ncbi:MAG TPA: glycosyltransferase family 2 protein [Rhodocyclaceae bacterium]
MNDWPKITVVTPSYNQAEFLERTILSVLEQGYPNLEYIVIDGGSSDQSVDIIRKYASRLAYWVSEADDGQSAAINKGLRRATGDWVGWQNSDDVFLPGALMAVGRAIKAAPKVGLVIGNMTLIDANDHELRDVRYVTPTYGSLLAERMVLTNQAAFWRRDLHDRIGYLNEELHYAFDYEWFLRLTKATKARHVNAMLGALRIHGETKTSLYADRFRSEDALILQGVQQPRYLKALYKARRLLLMLAQGEVAYVLRGCVRRLRGKGGDLY